jgi:hypothetical protein
MEKGQERLLTTWIEYVPIVPSHVREELHRVTTDRRIGSNNLPSQVESVLNVARRHGLGIRLQELADLHVEFNCFRHALGLRDLPEWVYNACQCATPQTGVKSDFIRTLIGGVLVERRPDSICEGDLVLYFDQEEVRHAGLVHTDHQVVSKWGSGHLWLHGLFEVPSAYGSEVRFYTPLDKEDALELFELHLRKQYGDDFVDDYRWT